MSRNKRIEIKTQYEKIRKCVTILLRIFDHKHQKKSIIVRNNINIIEGIFLTLSHDSRTDWIFRLALTIKKIIDHYY